MTVPSRVVIAGLLGLLLALGLAAAALSNLSYEGMWWDESASFWGSQGLSKYAEPFAQRRGLYEVLRMNCRENLDPGGFHVLLHLWTKLGRGLVWLRSLPFMFMLLGAVSLGLLGWRLTRSRGFALAALAVPLLYPATLYFGFEIRAFSMEMAGVACGALLLVLALDKSSFPRLALLGLTCAAFLTSRYSFVLTAAGIITALLFALVRRRLSRKQIVTKVAVVVLPVVVVGAGIVVMISRQMWPEMRGGGVVISSPVYTRSSVLGTGADTGALLSRNVVSPAALPITVAALFLLLGRRPAFAALALKPQHLETVRLRERIGALYVLVLSVQFFSVVVSLLGWYPWDIGARWSAYLVMVSALAVVVLAADLAVMARLESSLRGGGSRLWRHAEQIGIVIATLVVVMAFRHSSTYRQSLEDPYAARYVRVNVASQIDRLPIPSLREGSVFVAFYEVPMLKYLYECGPYAGRMEYPGVYRFETEAEWKRRVPIDAGREGISFIVSGLPMDAARVRFPGYSLHRVGSEGSRLLSVGGAAPTLPFE